MEPHYGFLKKSLCAQESKLNQKPNLIQTEITKQSHKVNPGRMVPATERVWKWHSTGWAH